MSSRKQKEQTATNAFEQIASAGSKSSFTSRKNSPSAASLARVRVGNTCPLVENDLGSLVALDCRQGQQLIDQRQRVGPSAMACVVSSFAAAKRPPLFLRVLLPLVFMFLLPTLKLERARLVHEAGAIKQLEEIAPTSAHTNHHHKQQYQRQQMLFGETTGDQINGLPLMSDLLLTLVRFPFDRLRLVSGLSQAAAKEITSKQDLQEEETHMQLVSPVSSGGQYRPQGYQHQQGTQMARSPQRAAEQMGHAYMPAESAQVAPGPDLHTGGEYGGADGLDGPAGIEAAEAPGQAPQTAGSGGGTGSGSGSGASAGVSTGLQARSDLPAVRALNVKCEKNHMTVNIVFDRPFYGLVFSKGHYNDQKCVHLPANSGQTSVNFDIHLGKCGMTSSDASGSAQAHALQQSAGVNGQQQPNGLYIENTIIIQYDPLVQEIYDQARKLRCTWYDYYEKSVTFRPYNVDMLDAVTANFLGDNIQCWMQIQVGKGPWSSEVAGIVKIGQTMTMVLAIKDDDNRFDMLVRNCVAHDGKHQPIQLVDEYGCVARPKIMAKFQKVRNFGPAATVVSYAYFQAFKFPDSMSVHFQCVIQVCRYECPEPVCGSGQQGGSDSNGGIAGPATGDYAASGTEIVSSKEPSPSLLGHHSPSGFFMAGAPPTNHSAARSTVAGASGGAAVNLKLEENQGRVQVKLDTSMMAGAGSRAPQSNGPLPPHLLHLAAETTGGGSGGSSSSALPASRPSGHAYLSSPYYKLPPPGGSGGSGGSDGSGIGRPALAPGQMPRQAQLAPPGQPQLHYSSPYSHRQVYAATNRIGELASASTPASEPGSVAELLAAAAASSSAAISAQQPAADQQALSLIASPRALRMVGSSGGPNHFAALPQNHRYRRSVQAAALAAQISGANFTPTNLDELSSARRRNTRNPQDSTAIRTHRTIQVVSPDDVAFSLLDPIAATPTVSGRTAQQWQQQVSIEQQLSTVCFSASRFLLAVLVTLATLATSIVIVVFVILKQRAQLDEKLSAVYDVGSAAAANHEQGAQEMATQQQQQARQSGICYQQVSPEVVTALGKAFQPHGATTAAAAELMARRQRDEIQQRNNYLARLYSQFMPANYQWRH